MSARFVWVVTVFALSAMFPATDLPSARYASGQASPSPIPALEVTHSQNLQTLPPYEVFEITFRHDQRYHNPFVDVAVDVALTSPSGKRVELGGFHYGSLDKPKIEVANDAAGAAKRKTVKYVFAQQNIWKARFAPGEPGHWTYAYVFTNSRGGKATGSGSFDCVPDPRNHHPGFVRPNPANPFRWVFDDGSPYFPIGLQDGVFDNTGTGSALAMMSMDGGFRPDRKGRPVLPPGDAFKVAPAKIVSGEVFFGTYGKAGFNLLRFSQQNFSLPLYRDLDHYLVQEGVMVDELLTCVRSHGFRVFYGFFGYQPVFAEHPDNAEGMAKVKRFVKYSVDRWGAYVDFWEFLNEQKADARWYEIMSPYLRSVDPYRHPIATNWERPELPGIEINAPHWYAGIRDEVGCDRDTAARAAGWKKSGKPVIVGEHGNHASKEELQVPGVGGVWDIRSATRMRIRNWTALFNEIALVFWNTSYAKDGHYMNIYLGPEERQYVRVMQDFAYRLDKDVRMAPVSVSDPKAVRGYGLVSPIRAGVYLHHFASHATPVSNLTLTLEVPKAGKARWYSPENGEVVRQADVPAGRQTLEVPPFQVDIALLIAPEEAAARAETAIEEAASQSTGWFPLQPVKDDFAPSVLDCSRFVEAPTGKHGFVTVRQDQFAFEDGAPARFWGAQMNMFDPRQLDYTIRRMRRQGINITRMHGMDYSRRGAATSFDYSPESFDRLDNLLAKLGAGGIYMVLDIHYPLNYRFKPGDGIPGLPQGGPAPFTQFFNEKAAAVMHRRMVDFFSHFNPYTKKRYADDPTLAMVEILNEDSLFWGSVPELFRPELEAKFAAWLAKKYGDTDGLKKAWTAGAKPPLAEEEGTAPGQRVHLIANPTFTEKYFQDHPEQKVRGQDQLRFYLELEDKYWADSRAALRKAGVRVPISATNWQGHGFPTRVHMLGQSRLDYIDRHGYWDHPQGEGNLKWNIRTALFHNQPMVKAIRPDQDRLFYLGVGNLVLEKAWEQVLGLPMTVSEWNMCAPNEFSLEGPGLMAAYGLLQGWDGPLEFGYFSPDWRSAMGPGSFDLFGNPPQILQFPAITAMWHRQDVREAEVVAESLYDPQSVFALTEDRKPVPIAAALVGKVGYRFVQEPRKPAVKDISNYWDAKSLTARSITGELTWNGSDGVVTIDTPRTQAVIGFLGKARHPMQAATIESPTAFGAVYVTAMDGAEPIRSARRILITAVGRAKNTGMEYEVASKTSRRGGPQWHLKSVGQAPVLLEAVTGRIEIRTAHGNQLKAWTLDIVGKRLQPVPLDRTADGVVLTMQAAHKTVYYELAAE